MSKIKTLYAAGGSLGNTKLSHQKKHRISVDAAAELTRGNPDILATACPLCKKTFTNSTRTKVADISEIVAEALVVPPAKKYLIFQNFSLKEAADIL